MKNRNNHYFFRQKRLVKAFFFVFFAVMNNQQPQIERHPWPPFIPEAAEYLLLGTFPPKPERWSMDFFYPNRTNDFWRVMGIIFYDDRNALWDESLKHFDLEKIKKLLAKEKIALWDTAMAVRRLKGNASDKFLEIVEPINLRALLDDNPSIIHIIATGEKAASVVAEQAATGIPPIGQPIACRIGTHDFTLWRMPSTSRAYPLALEKKAEAYRQIFG